MSADKFGRFAQAVLRWTGFVESDVNDLRQRVEDVRSDADDLEARVAATERTTADLEDLAERLRPAVVAVLSHAIRRQHLPQGFTFDSELWDRLRDLGGEEACSAVEVEIERSQAVLRCGSPNPAAPPSELVSRESDPKTGPAAENGFGICDP
jgi:hypothetical protein